MAKKKKKPASKKASTSSKEEPKGEKRKCFVIMPFTVREEDIPKYHGRKQHWNEVYEGLIKPAVESAGFFCERDDEDVSSRLITENIWRKLKSLKSYYVTSLPIIQMCFLN